MCYAIIKDKQTYIQTDFVDSGKIILLNAVIY